MKPEFYECKSKETKILFILHLKRLYFPLKKTQDFLMKSSKTKFHIKNFIVLV